MSHHVPNHQAPQGAPQRMPRILRLVLGSVIAICGVMMTVIVASQPQVAALFYTSAEHVSAQVEPQDRFGAAAPILLIGQNQGTDRDSVYSSAQPTATYLIHRKSSSHMPFDRTPVRRGGITAGN